MGTDTEVCPVCGRCPSSRTPNKDDADYAVCCAHIANAPWATAATSASSVVRFADSLMEALPS